MTVDRRIEDALPRILAELGAGTQADYAGLVLERAAHTRQRPGWRAPSGWMPRVAAPAIAGPRVRLALALLLLVLAIAGAVVYIGSRPRLPAPFGPARNGMLVFSTGGDIFSGTPDGPSTPIVAGQDFDYGAFYSPDGTRIAFYRRVGEDLDGPTDVMVANADGSDLIRLTQRPLTEIPWSAIWTPDSAAIAVMTQQRTDGHLELFDATRAADPRVIDEALHVDPGIHMGTFAFEPPDGGRILFDALVGTNVGLYTMDRDGINVTSLIQPYLAELPQNSGGYWNIASDIRDLRNSIWSPDGKWIVYQQYEVTAQSRQMRLFMMDDHGGNLHAITTPDGDSLDANPIWSPDGKRIAFMRYRLDRSRWTYAVLTLATGDVKTTGPDVPDGLDHDDWSPGLPIMAWSPDSTAVFAVERAGSRSAYVLDPDGGQAKPLDWQVETPHSWGLLGLNGFDPGSWQRLAGP